MTPTSKLKNKRKIATRSELKSSREARRLIRAAVKYTGTQRAAARLLRLPTQAQLVKMLHGQIRDTPAMKAAIARAKRRAQKSWGFIRDDDAPLDREIVCRLIHQLEIDLESIKALCGKAS